MLQSLFYLTTALHVSGVNITHLQKHKTTLTTASDVRHPQHTQINSNSSAKATDNNTVQRLPDYVVTVVLCS